MTLHDEQGISRTSVRDVARRADVAPSTVLQHFPRMDELVRACGELSDRLAPMPTDAILAGASGTAERVRRMASAMFDWWQDMGPGFDHLRVDRRRIPLVNGWMDDIARRHRLLAAAALGRLGGRRVDMLVALTTADAWGTFRDAGTDPSTAGSRVSQLIGFDDSTGKEPTH